MAQSGFTLLSVKNELPEEGTRPSNEISHRPKHVKSEAIPYSQVYVPVNFIPAEVCAFLAEWEGSYFAKMGSLDHMELELASVPASQNVLEPVRCLSDLAPPKRFYRTFWRSVTRRILEISRSHY